MWAKQAKSVTKLVFLLSFSQVCFNSFLFFTMHRMIAQNNVSLLVEVKLTQNKTKHLKLKIEHKIRFLCMMLHRIAVGIMSNI